MRKTRDLVLSLFTALYLVVAIVTTTGAGPHKDEAHGKEGKGRKASYEERRSKAKDWESHGHDGYFPAHGYTTLGIPQVICARLANAAPGIPIGLRVTNRPPERCEHPRYHAPVGTWLIHRPTREPQDVDVSVYDAYQPGLVISIGLFDVNTGAFLRHLRPR